MFCSQCGKPVSDDAKFCVFCGTAIEKEVARENTYVQPVYVPPVYEQQLYGKPVEEPKKKGGYVTSIVLSSISAFLMFLGLAFMIDDYSIGVFVSENARSAMILFVGPALVMTLVAFIRALKANRNQKSTGSKVVLIISTILLAIAILFMTVLFCLCVFDSFYMYDYPDYDFDFNYDYDTYL